MPQVVAARFAVPFYLRLPVGLLAGWEPESGACAILNFRRLGDLSFAGVSSLVSEASLIDSYDQRPVEIPEHQILMRCVLANGSEIPTLRISTGTGPGFTELRPYSELIIFFVVDSPVSDVTVLTSRVEAAANHLIDIYRAVTQDPFVRRVDFALDIFVVGYSFGIVPASLTGRPAAEIIRNIHQIQFSRELKDHRFHYRLNTWEDLFPGPLLDQVINDN